MSLILVSPSDDLKPVLFVEGEAELLAARGRGTSLVAVESSENGGSEFDWTIAGSIYNPETGLDSLAWWEPINGDINQWKLNTPENSRSTSQRFNDLSAAPGLQVAVGSVGLGLKTQGSAWYRTSPGEWSQASLENFRFSR